MTPEERPDRKEVPDAPDVPASDTPDDLSEVLSDRYSREVIAHLRDASDPMDVSDLARDVAAAVRNDHPDDVPSNVRQRVETWLHVGHLPSLDDHGLVTYDPESGEVGINHDAVP